MKVLWLSGLSDPGLRAAVADVVEVVRGDLPLLVSEPDWLASVTHLVVESAPGYENVQWGTVLLDEVGIRGTQVEELPVGTPYPRREPGGFTDQIPVVVRRLYGLVGDFRQSCVVITRDDAGIALLEDSADSLSFLFLNDGQRLARDVLPAELAVRVGDGYPGKEREEWLASREPPRVRDDLSVADHAFIGECLGVVLDAELWNSPDPDTAAAVSDPSWHRGYWCWCRVGS